MADVVETGVGGGLQIGLTDELRLSGLDFVQAQDRCGRVAERIEADRADGPLGKLDALTRGVLQRELARLWQTSGFTALLVTHDVDEAMMLADRILVLSERPGRIVGDLVVDVDRPRHHADPRLSNLRAAVLSLLGFPD